MAIIGVLVTVVGVGSVGAEGEHAHPHHFPADVEAFHQVLAPVWHAHSEGERLQGACAKVTEMRRQAEQIKSTDASKLLATVALLQDQCKGNPGRVAAALASVHDAFHQMIDAPSPSRR